MAGTLATHIALIKDSDQTARMRRLICVLDERTCLDVPFAGHRLILGLNYTIINIWIFQKIQNDGNSVKKNVHF